MKLTSKVEDAQAFYVKDGPALKSVKELLQGLEDNTISDDSFNFHVNNQDFTKWISDVYEDETLANALKRVKARKTFIKKLKEAL
jgi:hypothetical protein